MAQSLPSGKVVVKMLNKWPKTSASSSVGLSVRDVVDYQTIPMVVKKPSYLSLKK